MVFHIRTRRMAPRPVHGLTLVELLVLVAIIVALMALLLPAVNMAVAAARRVP
jgi:type II secretory pathway pseudopilin PulG